jgi:hypothetical protein
MALGVTSARAAHSVAVSTSPSYSASMTTSRAGCASTRTADGSPSTNSAGSRAALPPAFRVATPAP